MSEMIDAKNFVKQWGNQIPNKLQKYKQGDFAKESGEITLAQIMEDVEGKIWGDFSHRFNLAGLKKLNPKRRTVQGRKDTSFHDAENAQLVFKLLEDLTPGGALSSEFWVLLCHKPDVHEYIKKRWEGDHSAIGETQTSEQSAEFIKTRYFVKTQGRGLTMDNALSMLWWTGHIADKVARHQADGIEDSLTFQQVLEALCHLADIRSEVMTRPWLFTDTSLLHCTMTALTKSYCSDEQFLYRSLVSWTERPSHIQNNVFRTLTRRLSLEAGARSLAVLTYSEVNDIVTGVVDSIRSEIPQKKLE